MVEMRNPDPVLRKLSLSANSPPSFSTLLSERGPIESFTIQSLAWSAVLPRQFAEKCYYRTLIPPQSSLSAELRGQLLDP